MRADHRLTKFEGEWISLVKTLGLKTVSASISSHNKLVWTKSYGLTSLKSRRKANHKTLYPISSITKTFASVIITQLVREGKLSWDDPLSMYLPGKKLPPSVLVRHIMSHTSEGPEPGKQFLYSTRFAWLSEVITIVTGYEFDFLVTERIIKPLGLKNTFKDTASMLKSRYASNFVSAYRFDSDSRKLKTARHEDYKTSVSSGIISCGHDLINYTSALNGSKLLTNDEKSLLWNISSNDDTYAIPYNLGWFVNHFCNEKIIWHFGQEDTASSLLIMIPSRKLNFVMLTNSPLASDPFRLLDGNISRSLFALCFLKFLMLSGKKGDPLFDYVNGKQRNMMAVSSLGSKHWQYMTSSEWLGRLLMYDYLGKEKLCKKLFHCGYIFFLKFEHLQDLSLLFLLTRVKIDDPVSRLWKQLVVKLIAEQPVNPKLLYFIAVGYSQRGNVKAANSYFKKVVTLPNVNYSWYTYLSYFELGKYYFTHKPKKAIEYLTIIVKSKWNLSNIVNQSSSMLQMLNQA